MSTIQARTVQALRAWKFRRGGLLVCDDSTAHAYEALGLTLVRPGLAGSSCSGSCTGSRMMLRPYRTVDVAPSTSTAKMNAPHL